MRILDGTHTKEEIRLGFTPEEFADLTHDLLAAGHQPTQDDTAGKILRFAAVIIQGNTEEEAAAIREKLEQMGERSFRDNLTAAAEDFEAKNGRKVGG